MTRPRPSAVAARTVLAPISWGTTYVVVAELLPADRPLLVAVLRVLPAGLLLAAFGLVRSGWRPRGVEWGRTLALGACNFGLFFPLLFVAVYRLPGGVAAAAGGALPLLVLLVTFVAVGDRPRPAELAVAAAAAAGVAMVVVRPGAGIDPVGVLAALGANLSFACGVVLTKRLPRAADPVAATGWQLLVGGALILPVAVAVEGGVPPLDGRALGGFAYLSIVGTALAYLLWFDGVRRLPPVAAPLLGLAAPVTGATLGWVLLGEDLTAVQLLGFAVTLGAIGYGATIGARPTSRGAGGPDAASHPRRPAGDRVLAPGVAPAVGSRGSG